MFESQIELDFVEWLSDLSREVVVRYSRWLENADGESEDGEYCEECARLVSEERKAAGDDCHVVSGWDDAITCDSFRNCDKCGCLLWSSPTSEFIQSDIEWLQSAESIDAESAHSVLNWLSGMGDYRREEHWPLIRPHAERLLRIAGKEIVPDGFVRYVPAHNDWFPHDTIWLSIYQYFARKLVLWMDETGLGERGFLVDTSGCNVSHFAVITKPDDAEKCIRRLLKHIGTKGERGRFLESMGLSSHATLEQGILIPDGRCQLPAFDVRGRRLREPVNQFHPDAVVITHAELVLSSDAEEWSYLLYYSDKHWDRTSWTVSIHQNDVDSLPVFCDFVRQWMDEILVPVGPDDRWRSDRYRQWDIVREALGEIFAFGWDEFETREQLTDALMQLDGPVLHRHRIPFTKSIGRTLRRWIERARKAHDAKHMARR